MREASPSEQTKIAQLAKEVALVHGVSQVRVVEELAATRTLKRLGMTESAVLETEIQADACIQILESWKYKRRIK